MKLLLQVHRRGKRGIIIAYLILYFGFCDGLLLAVYSKCFFCGTCTEWVEYFEGFSFFEKKKESTRKFKKPLVIISDKKLTFVVVICVLVDWNLLWGGSSDCCCRFVIFFVAFVLAYREFGLSSLVLLGETLT